MRHSALRLTGLIALACCFALGAPVIWPDAVPVSPTAVADDNAPGRQMARLAVEQSKPWGTTDHSKMEALQADFTSGEQVTAACLSCHTEAADQFYQSIHWTWNAGKNEKGVEMGKARHSLNNFCVSANNWEDKGCMSCHPGWGTEKKAINCLVCHGQKEVKWEESFEDMNAFMEEDDPDLQEIARELAAGIQSGVQAVGRPTRKNCGSCHFFGGGGDGVKHGDLDSSLTNPARSLDVHMSHEGQDFDCVRCHTTHEHHIAGRIYTQPAFKERKSLIDDDLTAKISCESCHSATPHEPDHKANDHTDKVACQTCHIPRFARVNPTKMSWDWSKSGKLKDGKKYKQEGEFGKHDYLTIKGQMKWAKNVEPEYFWWNGSITSLTAKDQIDPATTVKLAHPAGDRSDPNSRIFPFKIHEGRQPYDIINRTLLTPLLSGPNGYWTTLDWEDALQRGSDTLGNEFSGKYGFVNSTFVYPTTHMVAPKSDTLKCSECHVRDNSRMASLTGFYMPGRDDAGIVDLLGWLVVLGSLGGVALHGLGRLIAGRKNGSNGGSGTEKGGEDA